METQFIITSRYEVAFLFFFFLIRVVLTTYSFVFIKIFEVRIIQITNCGAHQQTISELCAPSPGGLISKAVVLSPFCGVHPLGDE